MDVEANSLSIDFGSSRSFHTDSVIPRGQVGTISPSTGSLPKKATFEKWVSSSKKGHLET